MRASAYEGYFSNGLFYTSGKAVKIPEKRKVFLTIFEETKNMPEREANEQEESAQEWLDDLFRILQNDDKELGESDFPRISFRKPKELFSDGENL